MSEEKQVEKRIGRVPPYSEEAEKAIIGCVFLDPNQVVDTLIESKVRADDFFRPGHVEIFTAIGEMFVAGKAIDNLTLSDYMDGKGKLEKAGGKHYIDEILNDAFTLASLPHYVEILKKKSLSRRILALSYEIEDKAYQTDNPDELRGKAEAAFIRLEQDKPAVTLQSGLNTIIEDLIRIDNGGEPRPLGPSTGFNGLDKALGGGMGAGVNFITGEPGTGKTSLVCNIILKLIEQGKNVAFVTLEMSVDDMLQKLISIICEKNIRHALVGTGLADMEKVMKAKDILEGSGLFDIADQSVIQDDKQFVAWCRRKVLKDGAEIIVLDYLQLLDLADGNGMSEEQKVSSVSGMMKKVAAMLDVPLLVIGEENKDGKIRYSRRADYAGATHWRLLKVGDSEPQAPDFVQAFDVFTNKARFGVPNSKTPMKLVGSTGVVEEGPAGDDYYDFDKETEDLPDREDAGIDLFGEQE